MTLFPYTTLFRSILPPDYPLVCHAVSGYSGAGKKGIEQYESENRDRSLQTPRLYALGLTHKHLPEMTQISGLTRTPVFNPYICDYECGMSVTVPLFADLLSRSVTKEDLTEFYREWYKGERFVGVGREESGFLCANALNGTNRLEIFVNGNEERILLVSRLDNLGKGASGAAIQNMNLALGLDEGLGL